MPDSTCAPYTSLTGPDGRFARPDAIVGIFGDPGGAASILSCGSGMTACVLALAFEHIGVSARLYDGSWGDWGRGQLGPILTDAD